MTAADWYYAIDAQNFAGCWENLENIRHCMQGGWQGGYELYRWYISLKTCPNKKYKLLRLTLDKGDGPATVCTKELFEQHLLQTNDLAINDEYAYKRNRISETANAAQLVKVHGCPNARAFALTWHYLTPQRPTHSANNAGSFLIMSQGMTERLGKPLWGPWLLFQRH